MAALDLQAAVVGVSLRTPCGVRDHATALSREMSEQGISSGIHWLDRQQNSLLAASRELGAWARGLERALQVERPDVIIFHYSVFSYAQRGVPLFVPRVLAALRATEVPVVVVMHEFVFPWGSHGLRGKLWAVSQRLALAAVMRDASAVLVTTGDRERWLGSRRWLPSLPTALVPVFSNLPPAESGSDPKSDRHTIGVFGYTCNSETISLTLDAVRMLRERGSPVALELLGAPGPASRPGQDWILAARARGVAEALSFSGVLPAQELSNAIAGCTVLLFVAPGGPSSRKGTLAAALSSGAPVVAVAATSRWPELEREDALTIIEPRASAVMAALADLLADAGLREAAGARAKAFAGRWMSVGHTAAAMRALIEAVLA